MVHWNDLDKYRQYLMWHEMLHALGVSHVGLPPRHRRSCLQRICPLMFHQTIMPSPLPCTPSAEMDIASLNSLVQASIVMLDSAATAGDM